MKVSREQAALNRARIVEVAARLFRERGYDGIGVADLMKGAGLTHGGFYGHFGSKQELLAEACQLALGAGAERWRSVAAKAATPAEALQRITGSYLSAGHRDLPGLGCGVAALGSDVARLEGAARQALTAGVREQLAVLQGLAADGQGAHGAARQQAMTTYAAMVGAMVLARAVDDSALSDEILATVAAHLKG